MKPNLSVPLASSYDQRGHAAYTAAQAGYDQRKVNSYYEYGQNAINGKTSLILTKRPGVTKYEPTSLGSGTQVPYLCISDNASGVLPILFVKDGTSSKSVDAVNGSVTILNSSGYAPNFVTKTNISGSTTYVVQLRQGSVAALPQRMFYSSSPSSWTEITDSVFAAITHCGKAVHMNGRMFVLGLDGVWGSDLNTLETWPADNFVSKSIEQDLSVGLIGHQGRVLAFGENTCELFYYGDTSYGSQLLRMPDQFARVGLGRVAYASNSMIDYSAVVDDRLYFIGRYSKAYANSLVMYDGSRFERVSGDYEEKFMNGTEIYGMQTVSFYGKNGLAILQTAPGVSPAQWLMFFPDLKAWFEWESTVFSPINSGNWFAGVGSPDRLYYFTETYQDDGTDYRWMTQFRVPLEDDEYKTMIECGVVADASSASLNVSFNDGEGTSYSTPRPLDMSKAKKYISRCGMFRHRYVRLEYIGPQSMRLRSFYATVT